MRAKYPDFEGYIERDGIKVGYEVFGQGEPAVVFPPIDPVVSSRAWKAQVPYLARSSKVVSIDPRGNGRSDRPEVAAAYADAEFVADTIAVMDAVGVSRAVLVGTVQQCLVLAADGRAAPRTRTRRCQHLDLAAVPARLQVGQGASWVRRHAVHRRGLDR